jgi:Flp pilus assembly protein TadG
MWSLRARRTCRAFARRNEGGVGTPVVLALAPVALICALSVDYVRSHFAAAELKAAVDAASLAAAQKIGRPAAEIETTAMQALQAHLSSSALASVEVAVASVKGAGEPGVEVAAKGAMSTYVLSLLGQRTISVSAKSKAVAQDGAPIEIALVLDTTGSMANDIAAMKAAAKQFAGQAFAASTLTRMSVVPYVAAVNVGPQFNPASLDVNGRSSAHGLFMRSKWIGIMPTCNAYPYGGGSGGGAGAPVDYGAPTGKDRRAALEPSRFAPDASPRDLARRLFSVSQAAASPSVTANTVDPIFYSNQAYTPGPPYVTDGSTARVPQGYSTGYYCWLAQPAVISHLDLFNRIPGAKWKGCVEARPAPYDVTDDPPTPNAPETLFVPYFAPDEATYGAGGAFHNDYMSDSHKGWEQRNGAPPGWHADGHYEWSRNIMKYDGFNAARIVEKAPNSLGPNAYCPDEMLPLSRNKNEVLAKIDSLNYWVGGGTISSEGLMWGWRSLSPDAPFSMGEPYGESSKKFIVLMTDGLNSLVENRPGGATTVLSDYSAYGFLVDGRFGPPHFKTAEAFLNERMLAACSNAKAKGVGVFTILFRETDPATRALLKSCASSPDKALYAADTAALGAAFHDIAGQLTRLRLER